jgi:hypothetical protein
MLSLLELGDLCIRFLNFESGNLKLVAVPLVVHYHGPKQQDQKDWKPYINSTRSCP